MKQASIKTRITLWYAAFILLIVGVLLFALLVSQRALSKDYYYEKLNAAIEAAATEIQLVDGQIRIETETDSGARVTVLDENGELLVGKRKFTPRLKEEVLRVRERNMDENWYILDKSLRLEDGRTVWLRAYISSNLTDRVNRLIQVALLVMVPLLLAVVLVGGYLMTKLAFRPLDEITHTAESISDSSDLKQRIHLEGQTDEVGRLAQTFDGMFDRLDRSMESEKRFISDASHELRTPLSVICAQSEYALMPHRSLEEKDAALQIILERGKRSSEMLSQMLMLSRMDCDQLPLNLERVSLSDLIQSLAQEMQLKAAEAGIDVICEIPAPVDLVCDEILMMRMLMNLIQNAIQYGRPGGHVWIGLTQRADGVTLTVRDDGEGIPEADQDKVWRRFYQANKPENSSGGSGLGLPIVQRIVQAHRGSITLKSAPGQGSCFTIALPDRDNH